MSDYIFNLENDFQPYLPYGSYTFVGPANQDLLGNFTSIVKLLAPVINDVKSITSALSNKKVVKQAIATLYAGAELKVYIVEGDSPYGLIYTTIDEYCDRFDIKFRLHSS